MKKRVVKDGATNYTSGVDPHLDTILILCQYNAENGINPC